MPAASLKDGRNHVASDLAKRGDRGRLRPVAGVVPEPLHQKLSARGAAQSGERRSPHIGLRVLRGRHPQRLGVLPVSRIEPGDRRLTDRPEGVGSERGA